MIWNRIFCGIVLFIVAIVSPWWLGVTLALYFFFIFNSYYELIFLGLLFDILYGFRIGESMARRLTFFLASIFLFIVLSSFKKYLRFYV